MRWNVYRQVPLIDDVVALDALEDNSHQNPFANATM